MYLNSAPGLKLWPEQSINNLIKKIFFAVQNILWGRKKTNNSDPFLWGVLKSQIQPERSTHSPTDVKENLNYMLRE